jgi:DNA repair photolyase
MSIKITETSCKHALSRSGIYGWCYTINPYRGCGHSCVYCYAPNIIKAPRVDWGLYIEVKKNMPNILAKELKRLGIDKKGLTGLSSVTDPYQKIEEKYNLTRYCLEQLLKYQIPISIITKSPLVIRDIDLINKFDHAEVTISISTLDEQLAQIMEPKAPSIGSRLEALKSLSDDGLNTYAFLGPLLPVVDPRDIPDIMESIFKTNVGTVMMDSLNLKPGIWDALSQALNDYPGLRDIFKQRLFKNKNYYLEISDSIKRECLKNDVNFE